VIFTDLQAGSCTMASRRILRGMDDAVLIAGRNLPTLLDFRVLEGKTAPEAARHAAERGGSGDHRARGRRMTWSCIRIDDRLIHGQVVVGWGQPLDIGFIVLVDDTVREREWEQDLYRMGVPPEMDVYFHSATTRSRRSPSIARIRVRHSAHGRHRDDAPTGRRRRRRHGERRRHSLRAGRVQRLRYVFLSPDERSALRDCRARRGVRRRMSRRAARSARRLLAGNEP
jgi:PTS system mannose-specific IIB component/fructoselysine and glucoselysine-specific PTS system IIB component